jgi:hypothetical protein
MNLIIAANMRFNLIKLLLKLYDRKLVYTINRLYLKDYWKSLIEYF